MKLQTLMRHEGEAPRERSTCGWQERPRRQGNRVIARSSSTLGRAAPLCRGGYFNAL